MVEMLHLLNGDESGYNSNKSKGRKASIRPKKE